MFGAAKQEIIRSRALYWLADVQDTSASTLSQTEGLITPNHTSPLHVAKFGIKRTEERAFPWKPQYQSIQEVSRGWNEHHHPDSNDDKNAYFIEFDPSAPLFPGQGTLTRWSRNITELCSNPRSKQDLEQGRLGGSSSTINATSSLSSSSSNDEDEVLAAKKAILRKTRGNLPPRSHSIVRSYGTLPLHQRPVQQSTPSLTTTICLAASVVILAIVSVLVSTGRRRFRHEVDISGVRWCGSKSSFCNLRHGHRCTQVGET